MKYAVMICSLLATLNAFAGVNFDSSSKDIRAILDVPNLAELLNNGPIMKIEKIDSNTFEVDSGFCKAKVKVIRDETGVSSSKAESLGAECGP